MQTHPNHNFRKNCADEAFHLMPEVCSLAVCIFMGCACLRVEFFPSHHQQCFSPMPPALLMSNASPPAAHADRQGATSTSDREQLPPAPGFADDRRQGADIPPQLQKSRQLQSEGLEVRQSC